MFFGFVNFFLLSSAVLPPAFSSPRPVFPLHSLLSAFSDLQPYRVFVVGLHLCSSVLVDLLLFQRERLPEGFCFVGTN